MMKKYIYNKLRCILPTALLLLAVVSCSVTDSDEPCDAANEVTVHLGISITSARSVEGTQLGTGAPTDLMIWVFGKKAGDNAVYEDTPFDYKSVNEGLQFSGTDLEDRPVQTIPWTIDIQDYESLKFVVLMNTGSVTWNNNLSLDKDTKYSEIMAASFSGVNAALAKEDNQVLMVGEATQDLSSKRSYDITLEATRVVGKMELYFTKAVENSTLTITGVELFNIPTMGYMNGTNPTAYKNTDLDGEGVKLITETKTIDSWLSTDVEIGNFRHYEDKFTSTAQPYLLKNHNGGPEWIGYDTDDNDYIYDPEQRPESSYAYYLKVDYTWNGTAQTNGFYLPAIDPNYLYKIYVRVRNEQGLQLFYYVADWDDAEKYELKFEYPNYINPIQPEDGSAPPTGGRYSQPEVYANDDRSSDEGCYIFNFSISGPVGQKWTPTLLDATEADFEVTVSQNGVDVAPEDCIASSNSYQIKIRALKSENVDKTVKLAISYTPMWDPTGSSLLQINGQSGSPQWEGSNDPEVIVIKQIDVPTN